jgi:hypothetical protein
MKLSNLIEELKDVLECEGDIDVTHLLEGGKGFDMDNVSDIDVVRVEEYKNGNYVVLY